MIIEAPIQKRHFTPVPAEGEGGVFSQSWYPVAWSSEVGAGQVIGRTFLDGRIVVFRGANGRIVAASAYCAHLGADLAAGQVVGNNIRCAFHHWEYGQDGACVKVQTQASPPRGACLFRFPVQERFGIVWVFNGTEPLFDLPSFPHADDELEFAVAYEPQELPIDPWVFAANTPDMQHIKVVHKVSFDGADPHQLLNWKEFGFDYTYSGLDQGDVPTCYTLGIGGTSIFYRFGTYGEFWRGSIVGFGLPRPGHMTMYAINAVLKGPGAMERLATATQLSRRTMSEDKPIMDKLHYKPGYLIEGDQSLARFLNYVRKYPRAHPSADFIR